MLREYFRFKISTLVMVTGGGGAASTLAWVIYLILIKGNRDSNSQITWAGEYSDFLDILILHIVNVGTILGFISLILIIISWWRKITLSKLGILLTAIALFPFGLFLYMIAPTSFFAG